MDKARNALYYAYQAKKYDDVAREGLSILNEFRAFDERHVPMKSMVDNCCPIVSFAGQAFEKLGKPEIAKDLYRYVIHRGCMGMLPFTRLTILLERDREFQEAIGVCDKALTNKRFSGPTAEGAQREFSKRKARVENKLAKGCLK